MVQPHQDEKYKVHLPYGVRRGLNFSQKAALISGMPLTSVATGTWLWTLATIPNVPSQAVQLLAPIHVWTKYAALEARGHVEICSSTLAVSLGHRNLEFVFKNLQLGARDEEITQAY